MTWRSFFVLALCGGCGLTLDFEPDEEGSSDVGARDAGRDVAADVRPDSAEDTGPGDSEVDADGSACVCPSPRECLDDGSCGEPCGGTICDADLICEPSSETCVMPCGGEPCPLGYNCIREECVAPCDPAECEDGDVCLDRIECGPCRLDGDCGPGLRCDEELGCIPPSCGEPDDCADSAPDCRTWDCQEGECVYPEPLASRSLCADGLSTCNGMGGCLPYCGDSITDFTFEACDNGPDGGAGCTSDCRLGCSRDRDCFDLDSCRTGTCDRASARCTFDPLPRCRECVDGTVVLSGDMDLDGFVSCDDEVCSPGVGRCDCNDRLALANPDSPLPILARCPFPRLIRCGRDEDDDGAQVIVALLDVGDVCRDGEVLIRAGDDIDCNDDEEDVKPSQTLFFRAPIPDAADEARDFDYNCDGIETRLFTQRFAGCGEDCSDMQSGWLSFVIPECGVEEDWVSCAIVEGECEIVAGMQVQACL